MRNRSKSGRKVSCGSALLLAVVLTSMLAVVGIMFVMAGRVEKIAASSVSENKDLNLAVDAVVAGIMEELILDIKTPDPNNPAGSYYDYPDALNPWLACLEPYEAAAGDYRWRRISDIYKMPDLSGRMLGPFADDLPAEIVAEGKGGLLTAPADADGDGVADSRWVRLPDMTSSRGTDIYAAVRVIDNSAMLNVNTGFRFDKTADGSRLTQVNLMALSSRNPPPYDPCAESELLNMRCLNDAISGNLDLYENNVTWHMFEPPLAFIDSYAPFDISDELEMRQRFVLNQQYVKTRLEDWTSELYARGKKVNWTPFDSNLVEWFATASAEHGLTQEYAYRHLATTYNMDRIIAPDGIKMANINAVADANDVNSPDLRLLYDALRQGLADAGVDVAVAPAMAGQMAVNVRDYRDSDSNVSALDIDTDGDNVLDTTVYGFETPCVYISELVYKKEPDSNQAYAVELHKPYAEDEDPINWRLTINNSLGARVIDVNVIWLGTDQFHVIEWDQDEIMAVVWGEPNSLNPPDGANDVPCGTDLSWPSVAGADAYDVYLGTDYTEVETADRNSDVYKAQTSVTRYVLGGVLDANTTYYWRIDAFDGGTLLSQDIRSFTTADASTPVRQPEAQAEIFPSDSNEVFAAGWVVQLRRPVIGRGYVIVDEAPPVPNWLTDDSNAIATNSFQRDITRHKCIRRLWAASDRLSTLGYTNTYTVTEVADDIYIQAHPADEKFTNIGEIGMVFRRDAYGVIGYAADAKTEGWVRINLADPNFQHLFNYLTVFDPSADVIDNDADGRLNETEFALTPELKIPGRININTAPWYVIAQLPWVFEPLAQAIVAYREKTAVPGGPDYTGRRGNPGFSSIGELCNVNVGINRFASMDYYSRIRVDVNDFPDLTPADKAVNDFEERDLIFARISNLVTVRSDVFTAYILVRIGTNGPQKRAIAILDRSDVYPDGAGGTIGKVKLRALQPVPDPR